MNAEMIAGALTLALIYALILFNVYQSTSDWAGRKDLATILPARKHQFLTTREQLRQHLRAKLRNKTQ